MSDTEEVNGYPLLEEVPHLDETPPTKEDKKN